LKLTNKHILWTILAVAVLLRCWSFWDIPFTHDEFSAIFRLEHDNLGDLISFGIKEDGHPAGVQLFLYFWSALFGTGELAVKLPFLLMGTAAIYLTYLVGTRLKNESAGLISAAILCGLQYTVMYSQIARPYISGMFLSLCMFLYLLKLAQEGEAKFWKNLFLFSIFGALCAYNHHFSLLQAALIGLSGFYFINKTYWFKYSVSALLIFILYAPHLHIFFYQLDKGGVSEWLNEPEADFIWNYTRYIFNYSWLFLSGAFGIFILSLYMGFIQEWKKIIVLLSLFLIPYLIGYYYSIKVEAVLQFSVLIFAFPFLVLGLCTGLKEMEIKFNALLVITILSLSSLTLINHRKHYQVFYESIYYLPLQGGAHLKTSAPVILLGDENIYRETAKKSKRKSKVFVYLSQVNSPKRYLQVLDSIAKRNNEIAIAKQDFISPNYLAYVKNYFPNLRYRKDLFLGSYYVLNKQTPLAKRKLTIPMKKEDGGRRLSADQEWGPGIELNYSDLIKNQGLIMDVNLFIKPKKELKDFLIVSHIYSKNNKEILWRATNCSEWENKEGKYHHSIRLSAEILRDHPDAKIKVFLWNKGKQNLDLKDFYLTTSKINPYLYGLIEEI
jgi:uncharacterized membrane protein